ncbi:MAG TPA: adenylate/guanylate cyclase domain-containing protein [Acidimicrobiales bacterium]|nr:adenylate/guanylate cyclase domain-containing protein [Acidimicrobiales bacterium]
MTVASQHEAQLPAEDERRLVTVVFADVVGFTTMGEDLDPEQLKNLVATCFERLAADVTKHGGRVDKIMGDELVAMFGAPLAYGDDAERAVRAALQMVETAAVGPAALELRVGVNTGEALVGQIRPGEYTAMGDVVNVGSRLKGLADPGSVVVGPMTYEATRSAVSYEPLGHLETRGRRASVAAWKAIGAVAPPGAPSSRPRAPLVGRDYELGLLKSALDAAAARRRAQLVVLLGEAGVGKTRLASELADHARVAHDAVVLEGRCVPYGEANPWWPIAEALRDALSVRSSDSADESAAKAAAKLSSALDLPADHPEVKRLADGLAHLMGDEDSLKDVDPARARDEGRRALRGLLAGLTRDRPALVVLSELHWADPLLLDQLGKLEGLHDLPLVLVATARPELTERWQPPFANHDAILLHLGPLSPDDARALASALVEDADDVAVADLLAERSGGNAFFLEELAALFNEKEEGATAKADLPATLRGILAARLDGLTPQERGLLEDAAVVGRSGELDALVALAEARGDNTAVQVAQSLSSRDLIELNDAMWSFRSNLLQEVAYETLTKAERARRHARLAAWLTEHRCRLGREDEELEHVAHHWSVAAALARGLGVVPGLPQDLNDRAREWLERSMSRARQRELHLSGLSLVEHARELLDPADVEGDHRTRLYRASARAAVRDLHGARGDVEAVIHASDDRSASPHHRARALTILGDIEQKESKFGRSFETLTDALETWRSLDDKEQEAEALRLRGMTLVLQGRPAEAEEDIHSALAAFREVGDRRGEAWALQALAWAAFSTGHAQACERRLDASQEAFTEIGDWGGLGWVFGLRAWLKYQQGDLEAAENLANAVIPEARELGDDWALGMVVMLQAAVRLWKGDPLGAIPLGEEAREIFRNLDDPINEMRSLGPLTRALVAVGRHLEARAMFEEAWARSRRTSYAGGDVFAALMDGTAAVHVGDAERAMRAGMVAIENLDDPVDEVGEPERLVLAGAAALMGGNVEAACVHLEEASARSDRARPNTAAWLALARSATARLSEAVEGANGRSGAQLDAARDLAQQAHALGDVSGTYFDRVLAHLATGLAGEPEQLDTAVDVADKTGDVVMQAVARLGRAIGREAHGDPAAEEALIDALRRFESLGLTGAGWNTALRLAAGLK